MCCGWSFAPVAVVLGGEWQGDSIHTMPPATPCLLLQANGILQTTDDQPTRPASQAASQAGRQQPSIGLYQSHAHAAGLAAGLQGSWVCHILTRHAAAALANHHWQML